MLGSRCFVFFFFKQKTAYEITYGDWSSDVCSSDLILAASIPLSWAPYAADFSRYLARDTARRRVFARAFLGMAVACIWVEVIGVMLTTSLGFWGDPVLVFAHALGGGLVVPLLLLLVVNL